MQNRGRGVARRKEKPGSVASGPHLNAQIQPLRQLQVQEDPHNEREQRQCLHEYQTQQHGGANASSRSGIACDALTRSCSDASLAPVRRQPPAMATPKPAANASVPGLRGAFSPVAPPCANAAGAIIITATSTVKQPLLSSFEFLLQNCRQEVVPDTVQPGSR